MRLVRIVGFLSTASSEIMGDRVSEVKRARRKGASNVRCVLRLIVTDFLTVLSYLGLALLGSRVVRASFVLCECVQSVWAGRAERPKKVRKVERK